MYRLILATLLLTIAAPAAQAERNRECFNESTLWMGGCVSGEKAVRGSGYRGKTSTSNTPGGPNTPGNPNTPGSSNPGNQGKNNGFGNGDQAAPGNSGPHNNAENSQHSGRGNSSNAPGHNK